MPKWMWLVIVICFCCGFIWGRLTKPPKIITKEVVKVETVEVKVYDFTQEPEAMQRYASMMNKILVDKSEFEKKVFVDREEYYKNSINQWAEGYREGFRLGFNSRRR